MRSPVYREGLGMQTGAPAYTNDGQQSRQVASYARPLAIASGNRQMKTSPEQMQASSVAIEKVPAKRTVASSDPTTEARQPNKQASDKQASDKQPSDKQPSQVQQVSWEVPVDDKTLLKADQPAASVASKSTDAPDSAVAKKSVPEPAVHGGSAAIVPEHFAWGYFGKSRN